jgi:hypothetical protein
VEPQSSSVSAARALSSMSAAQESSSVSAARESSSVSANSTGYWSIDLSSGLRKVSSVDRIMQAPNQHTEACTLTLVVPVQDGNDPKTLSYG